MRTAAVLNLRAPAATRSDQGRVAASRGATVFDPPQLDFSTTHTVWTVADRGTPALGQARETAWSSVRGHRRSCAATDIAEAEAFGDVGRAEKARGEREELVAQLTSALGLSGRARRLDDVGERARKAVTWRIRRAIKTIAEVDPQLGWHLDETVRTGTFCAYAPEDAVRWAVRS